MSVSALMASTSKTSRFFLIKLLLSERNFFRYLLSESVVCFYAPALGGGGVLSDTAIRPSVCPMAPLPRL